jgi:hypothetical protein
MPKSISFHHSPEMEQCRQHNKDVEDAMGLDAVVKDTGVPSFRPAGGVETSTDEVAEGTAKDRTEGHAVGDVLQLIFFFNVFISTKVIRGMLVRFFLVVVSDG